MRYVYENLAKMLWVVELANELDRLAFRYVAESVRGEAAERGVEAVVFETSGYRYHPEEALSDRDRQLAFEIADELEAVGFRCAARGLRADAAERVRDPEHVSWVRAARRAVGLRVWS